LLRQPEVNNATGLNASIEFEFRTLITVFFNSTQLVLVIHFSKILRSQRHWIKNDPSTHSLDMIRHPKEGRFKLTSCQPPLSAQRTKSMVAHANQCLLGST